MTDDRSDRFDEPTGAADERDHEGGGTDGGTGSIDDVDLGVGTGPGEDVGTGGVGAGGDLEGYAGGMGTGGTSTDGGGAGTDVGGAGTGTGLGGQGGDLPTGEDV